MLSASLNILPARPIAGHIQHRTVVAAPGAATGYTELDVLLPDGGWPAGALTEICVERPGIGELQLLMPAAALLTRNAQWLAMVNPPYAPHAPALAALGVHLQQVLVLHPQSVDEQVLAAVRLLDSGRCGIVLMWLDQVQAGMVHRLQRAAERSGALVVIYRPRRAPPFSGVALRLRVSKTEGRTVIHLQQRQGDVAVSPVKLDLHGPLTRRPLPPPPLRGLNLSHLQAAH